MDRTSLTRWTLATLIFVAIAWASVNYGLGWGRALLIAGLLIVFFFGGTSKHRSRSSSEPTPESESEPGDDSA
jgi:hypothetical protein